jgi:hypothetical protein
MSDVGFFALSLGLMTTTYSVVGLVLGIRKGEERLVASSRRAIYASTAFLTLAVLALVYVLVARDFYPSTLVWEPWLSVVRDTTSRGTRLSSWVVSWPSSWCWSSSSTTPSRGWILCPATGWG